MWALRGDQGAQPEQIQETIRGSQEGREILENENISMNIHEESPLVLNHNLSKKVLQSFKIWKNNESYEGWRILSIL